MGYPVHPLFGRSASPPRDRSRGIGEDNGRGLFIAIEDHPVDHLHGAHLKAFEDSSHIIPETLLALELFSDRAEESTGELLSLIDEEGKHHEQDEIDQEIFFPKAIVVLEAVALIFESVEGLMVSQRPLAA